MGLMEDFFKMFLGMVNNLVMKNFKVDENEIVCKRVIVLLMILEERENLDFFNLSCRCCIVVGLGNIFVDVNKFIKDFN